MDKFRASSYVWDYELIDAKTLTRENMVNSTLLMLQMGRGGIRVYKIMTVLDAYKYYGYHWIQNRCQEDYIIVKPKVED